MSSASDLVEGRAWTAHIASVSRECFQYSSLSVLGHCFSSEFVGVRVFSDCCFSCLSLGACDAHIFTSSHDRSSTLCSAYVKRAARAEKLVHLGERTLRTQAALMDGRPNGMTAEHLRPLLVNDREVVQFCQNCGSW